MNIAEFRFRLPDNDVCLMFTAMNFKYMWKKLMKTCHLCTVRYTCALQPDAIKNV